MDTQRGLGLAAALILARCGSGIGQWPYWERQVRLLLDQGAANLQTRGRGDDHHPQHRPDPGHAPDRPALARPVPSLAG
jgi:hypothetical protein